MRKCSATAAPAAVSSDFFESLFAGQRGGRPRGPGAGAGPGAQTRGDTRAKLAVPLEAVYSGDSVRITITGKQLDVRVPKGIQPGQVIRLSGQGNGGGNLLLEIEYAAHPQFEVDGRNILYTLQVMPWQAALGTTISVPTLGGAVELKVPADSEAGRKLRLRGAACRAPPRATRSWSWKSWPRRPPTRRRRRRIGRWPRPSANRSDAVGVVMQRVLMCQRALHCPAAGPVVRVAGVVLWAAANRVAVAARRGFARSMA